MAVSINFYILLNFVHNASVFYSNTINHPQFGDVVQTPFYHVCRNSNSAGAGVCWPASSPLGLVIRVIPVPAMNDAGVGLAVGMGTKDE